MATASAGTTYFAKILSKFPLDSSRALFLTETGIINNKSPTSAIKGCDFIIKINATITPAKRTNDKIDKKMDFPLIDSLQNIHNNNIKCGQVKTKKGSKKQMSF